MKRDEGEPRTWLLALAVLVIALAAMVLLGGCSALKVEGACTYERTVKTSYQCEPGSSLEHTRVAPGSAPE